MNRPRTVGFALKGLSNQIKRMMDNNAQSNNCDRLTGMQHGMIGFIGKQSQYRDVFQKDVETEFNIRRSTATGILQLMERNGLITREPVAQDARLKKLVLTEKAIQIHEQVTREILEMEGRMTRGISQEDLDTFFRVIEAISKNIES